MFLFMKSYLDVSVYLLLFIPAFLYLLKLLKSPSNAMNASSFYSLMMHSGSSVIIK